MNGLYVGDVVTSRATNQRGQPRFFALSRKRTAPDGSFAGVIVMSISPDYFRDYYATLTQPIVAALIRADGAVLARYPEVPYPARLSRGNTFQSALEQGRAVRSAHRGIGARRQGAHFRIPPVAAHSRLHDRRRRHRGHHAGAGSTGMARHLIFGLPATAAMIALCLLALRRTRREAAANLHAARRNRAPRGDRGSAAPVAKDGGGRPADRRHRARLQQSAHRHHRQSRSRAAPRLDGEDRVRTWLSNCRQAAERAATLVQRLLAFSRQHPLEVKSVDINRLVQGMSELLHRALGETVTIETVLAGGLWKAAIDPNQLENAILNLAVNARDAMARRRAAHHRDRELPSRRALHRADRRRDRARAVRHGGGERFRHRHDAPR